MKNLVNYFMKWVLCKMCKGTGVSLDDWNSVSECPYCKGKGWIKQ